MNSGDSGSYTRLRYDSCAYAKSLNESTDPLKYYLFESKFENCGKCGAKENGFFRPFDLVDEESELRGITRVNSKCPQKKYTPSCAKSGICTSTFDPKVPVVYAPEVCPIVHNNLPVINTPGFSAPDKAYCKY
jgi:hypothetical protein